MKTPYMAKLPVVLVAGLGGFFTAWMRPFPAFDPATTAPKMSGPRLFGGWHKTAAAELRTLLCRPPTPIYVSTNAGATWIATSAEQHWTSVASLGAVPRPGG